MRKPSAHFGAQQLLRGHRVQLHNGTGEKGCKPVKQNKMLRGKAHGSLCWHQALHYHNVMNRPFQNCSHFALLPIEHQPQALHRRKSNMRHPGFTSEAKWPTWMHGPYRALRWLLKSESKQGTCWTCHCQTSSGLLFPRTLALLQWWGFLQTHAQSLDAPVSQLL